MGGGEGGAVGSVAHTQFMKHDLCYLDPIRDFFAFRISTNKQWPDHPRVDAATGDLSTITQGDVRPAAAVRGIGEDCPC